VTQLHHFRKGKIQGFKLIEKRPYLFNSIKEFYNSNTNKDCVSKAGEMFILAMYDASDKETNLNKYRYQCFAINVLNNKNVLLGLPSSEAAQWNICFEFTTKSKHGLEIRNHEKNGAGIKQIMFYRLYPYKFL